MAGILVDISANITKLRKGLNRGKRSLLSWSWDVTKGMLRYGRNAGIAFARGLYRTVRRGAMVVGGVLAAGIGKSISEAARFEAFELQFEALLGSAEEAQKRMEEIKKVDLEVPFDITGLTDASRVLTVFTNNAFAATDALKMMADAAAVTPNSIEDVAFWYGRAYSMIDAGRPFGEAAMRLQEMGLLTGQARTEMEKLSGTGARMNKGKMLDVLNREFLKFQGASDKMMTTWKGIRSVFTSGVKQSFAAVGDAILPLAKKWLQEVIDKMQELRDNGTLTRWGQNIAAALAAVRKAIEDAIPLVQKFWDRLNASAAVKGWKQTIKDELEGVSEVIASTFTTFAKKHGETIVKVGVEIGGSLVRGIFKGIDKEMTGDKASIWKALVGDPARLVSETAKWGTASGQRKDTRQANREREIAFGKRLYDAQGKSPVFGKEEAYIRMANKGYENKQWAMGVLQVEVMKDHTKNPTGGF